MDKLSIIKYHQAGEVLAKYLEWRKQMEKQYGRMIYIGGK